MPLLISGGIYRLRVQEKRHLPPALLLALLNMRVVRRQMRNKQFTRDVIDTLGHRLLEVVLPIPADARDKDLIARTVGRLLKARGALRADAWRLRTEIEAA